MKKNIFVLSDQIVHWNFIPTSHGKNIFMEMWGEHSTAHFIESINSAFQQIDAAIEMIPQPVSPTPGKCEEITPCDPSFNHAFVTWKQFPEGKSKAWRINEIVHVGESADSIFDEASGKALQSADLVLIQDWGLDIRNYDLPSISSSLKDKWVIYRCYPPIFEGNLWQDFQGVDGRKKMLLVRADDLRGLNTSISKGLSWEQTLQDIIEEIFCKQNISLYPLRTMEYILISFGCTASLLIHNVTNQKPKITFFFDAMSEEGAWEQEHPGYLPGDLELLAVLAAREVLNTAENEDIHLNRAIRTHLLARRSTLVEGAVINDIKNGSLVLDQITDAIKKIYGQEPIHDFTPVSLDVDFFRSSYAEKQIDRSSSTDWSLLGMTRWDLYSLARQIALHGPMQALKGWNIPIAKYKFLLTADRKEIEFLHNLKALISEYLQNNSSQPLSIAVFGAPGSGKSFSIKQLAKALNLPGQEIQDITFNLSQFNEENPTDLYQAFHAVRDIALSGKIPLVFWDEFDSKDLAWLRYFLAPMQDGEFQEGQLIHNMGKSIFVFAGGTCTCMEEFEEKVQDARSQKGPDFLSRLKGYINVMGPNPILPYAERKEVGNDSLDKTSLINLSKNADPEYIIRRAILVNSLLSLNYPQLVENGDLQIDDGVLNAFLMAPQFKHGTRSMETIFKTSRLAHEHKYNRSDLPPQSQMDLHVDGQQFYTLLTQEFQHYEGGESFYHLVNEINLDESTIEKMAIGIHAIYSLVFSSGKQDNPLTITKEEFLAEYTKLTGLPEGTPPDEVSQNYHNARKIPEKLAAVGFGIVPEDAMDDSIPFTPKELEKLSQLEHIRWVQHHIDAGWAFSPVKDKSHKLHDALVPWDEEESKNAEMIYGKGYISKMGLKPGMILSEHYRNLDRVITLAIPWILEHVGYKMVRMKEYPAK